MSEFKFMQYGDLTVAEELTETAHVLVEEDGGIKRFPVVGLGVGSGGVQPDLSQNDPTAADYVKGHTLDDAVSLVADCGLASPATDENGAILVDENNDVLIF